MECLWCLLLRSFLSSLESGVLGFLGLFTILVEIDELLCGQLDSGHERSAHGYLRVVRYHLPHESFEKGDVLSNPHLGCGVASVVCFLFPLLDTL